MKKYLENGYFITEYDNLLAFKYDQLVYHIIKDCRGVLETEFSEMTSKRKWIGECLEDMTLSDESKTNYKHQLLSILKEVNSLGIGHFDIHTRNIIVENNTLYLIDWDLAGVEPNKFPDCFDVIGGSANKFGGYVFSTEIDNFRIFEKLNITHSDLWT